MLGCVLSHKRCYIGNLCLLRLLTEVALTTEARSLFQNLMTLVEKNDPPGDGCDKVAHYWELFIMKVNPVV